MECPACGVDNPPESIVCDCGFDLEIGEEKKEYKNQAAYVKPQKYSNGLKKSNKKLYILIGVFAFIILVSIMGNKEETSKPKEIPDLSASVSFDGTQFIIKNNDLVDWNDVKFSINSKLFSSGYSYKAPFSIKARETYTIGASQFTKSDGERFNPFTHKPMDLTIFGKIRGEDGIYVGKWE
jgi:hypothetical protein